jgi:hypothetical protein
MPDYKSRDIAQLQVVGYTVCFAVVCWLSSRQIWSGHTQRPFLGKCFPSVRGQYNLSFPISPPPSLVDSQMHNQLAAV